MNEQDIDFMIGACQQNMARLNDWERGFIDSLYLQRRNGQEFREKMLLLLREVHEKATTRE